MKRGHTAKIIDFVSRVRLAQGSGPKNPDDLTYVYLVYEIDRIKNTRTMVYPCTRKDFAVKYMQEHEGETYGITYETEGWPVDWYDQQR